MKRLKDNYRISLTLHLIEGYDYEEVSKIMDISYANCRTTISRAKGKFEKKNDKCLNYARRKFRRIVQRARG